MVWTCSSFSIKGKHSDIFLHGQAVADSIVQQQQARHRGTTTRAASVSTCAQTNFATTKTAKVRDLA